MEPKVKLKPVEISALDILGPSGQNTHVERI